LHSPSLSLSKPMQNKISLKNCILSIRNIVCNQNQKNQRHCFISPHVLFFFFPPFSLFFYVYLFLLFHLTTVNKGLIYYAGSEDKNQGVVCFFQWQQKVLAVISVVANQLISISLCKIMFLNFPLPLYSCSSPFSFPIFLFAHKRKNLCFFYSSPFAFWIDE
jgi:hypothetical protein